MKSRPIAAIDIGTNTFRLLIGYVRFDPKTGNYSIEEVYSERIITRLGQGISQKGMISEAAIKKGVAVLKSFSEKISHHQVLKTSALATCALRDAENKDTFLNRSKEESGLEISIISGEEEARITSLGMLIDIEPPESALMADIGGGSTEIIFNSKGSFLSVNSLKLGVVYLADTYMKNDPPLNNDLIKMHDEISNKINTLIKPLKRSFTEKTVLVGTAGTVTSLASISLHLKTYDHNKIHNSKISFKKVKKIFDNISTITLKERAKYYALEPGRLDIIVPGTLILLNIMETFNFKELLVSDYGLREGILLDLHNRSK